MRILKVVAPALLFSGLGMATLIDDFSIGSPTVTAFSGVGACTVPHDAGLSVAVECINGAGIGSIGGLTATRTLTADYDGGSPGTDVLSRVVGGAFTSSRDVGVSGQSQASYDFALTDLTAAGGLQIDVLSSSEGPILFYFYIGNASTIARSVGIMIGPGASTISADWGSFFGGPVSAAILTNATRVGYVVSDDAGPASFDVALDNFQTIPEPGTMALIGLGLAAVGILGRRRKK